MYSCSVQAKKHYIGVILPDFRVAQVLSESQLCILLALWAMLMEAAWRRLEMLRVALMGRFERLALAAMGGCGY